MEREALRERVAKNLLRYQGTDHARQIAERDFSEASGVVRITEDQLREIDDAGIYEVYYHYDYDHWIIQKRPVISITPKQIRIAKKWDDGYRVLPRQRIEGGEVVEVKQQSYGSGRTTRRLLEEQLHQWQARLERVRTHHEEVEAAFHRGEFPLDRQERAMLDRVVADLYGEETPVKKHDWKKYGF